MGVLYDKFYLSKCLYIHSSREIILQPCLKLLSQVQFYLENIYIVWNELLNIKWQLWSICAINLVFIFSKHLLLEKKRMETCLGITWVIWINNLVPGESRREKRENVGELSLSFYLAAENYTLHLFLKYFIVYAKATICFSMFKSTNILMSCWTCRPRIINWCRNYKTQVKKHLLSKPRKWDRAEEKHVRRMMFQCVSQKEGN